MAREDLVQCEGRITDIAGGGIYRIQLENGVEVTAQLCGKMKKFRIRVIVGDKVTVGVSPYDPTHGLVLHRFRA
ncbi:MAG: translation initiation factor IF-1 [Bdellovibrionales bacterium]